MTNTVPGWISPQYGGTASGAGPTVWNMDDPPPNPAIYAGYGSLEVPPDVTLPAAQTPTPTPPAVDTNNWNFEIEPTTALIAAVLAFGIVLIATR